jgi:hypothetical protein
MIMEKVEEFMARGGAISIGRTRKTKGVKPLASSFGGNRLFLSSRAVSVADQGGMLRMGTGLRKYGN